MSQNIVEAFNSNFRLIPATTDELLEEAYKLRYQIYCIETHFENPENHPGGKEKDDFDAISLHYLIQHKATRLYAATTRLVLADSDDPERLFPIELFTQIDRKDLVANVPRERIAEVSRFCVSKDFKRRAGEQGTLAGIPMTESLPVEQERRLFSHIMIALITCLVRMSRQRGVTHWYAVMEPILIRRLRYLGIFFTPIGPTSEYHGIRVPCFIVLEDMLESIKQNNYQAWELVTQDDHPL